jgi:hypothetical protein
MIDWNNVIASLPDEGEVVMPLSDRWDLSNLEYLKIYNQWTQAKFNLSAIKWTNYYPGIHFDTSIVEEFANTLGVKILRSWISRIDPGYFAPWHWDVDDHEDEYLKQGNPIRYSCFIENPSHGHIFIVDDEYFYNQPQGTVVKWKNYKSWHSGINAGLEPKYMLHLLAVYS